MSSTVARATQLLERLAEGPRSLGELAEELQVHRSTVLRQLQTLESAGFALRRPNGCYTVGPRLISIAQLALESIDLRSVAHSEIRALGERVGHTVHLAQWMGTRIVYIDKVEGNTETIRIYSRIGKEALPNCSGVGKAILAQMGPTEREEVLREATWRPYTKRTLITRESLDAELAEVARRGWAEDDGEFEDFVNCIAVPIRDSTGTILGAASITKLRMVCPLQELREHLDDLRQVAKTISTQLG